jgi:hypothetical protein
LGKFTRALLGSILVRVVPYLIGKPWQETFRIEEKLNKRVIRFKMTRTFAESRGVVEPFGSYSPFAEPAWYNSLASPYYNDSHRALRNYAREYIKEHIEPFAEQWEEDGIVPEQARRNFIKAGFVFQDLPPQYRNGVSLPLNIPYEGRFSWDSRTRDDEKIS